MFNFAISTYFLVYGDEYYNYFLGSRTVTGLLTNTMLVSNKLSGWFSYARISYTNGWACSLFNVNPLSYNRVDDNVRVALKKLGEKVRASDFVRPSIAVLDVAEPQALDRLREHLDE